MSKDETAALLAEWNDPYSDPDTRAILSDCSAFLTRTAQNPALNNRISRWFRVGHEFQPTGTSRRKWLR